MCGIAGIVWRNRSSCSPNALKTFVDQMLSRINHRGREDPKDFDGDGVCLGCCRLPVLDRENGTQPIINEDRTVIAVFNGEIYNHADLKQMLITEGHEIASDCDSHLMVHLYEHHGRTAVAMHKDLRGMYVTAIWDSKFQRCSLIRDPIGKKPLYVLETDEVVAFASEAKSFGHSDQISAFGSNRKVWELGPGETVVIEGSHIQREESIPPWKMRSAPLIQNMDEAAERLRIVLTESVRLRMPQDLAVAALCSGGIDSLIISYLAQQYSNERKLNFKAYVIGKRNSPDVLAATSACEKLQIQLEQILIDESVLPSLVSEVVYHTESFEPNIVRNSLLAYLLFKRIRTDDYRVALCGEGADELFFGYADFANAAKPEALMSQLLSDLHRTQLLRVDRMSMAFNLETRVPFLDREVIKLACSIAPDLKHTRVYGEWQGKAVLRWAFRDVLPWEVVTRAKATFSYGAGLGDVGMTSDNPLEEYAKRVLRTNEVSRLKDTYRHIDLTTYERVLYLYYFEQFFIVPAGYSPPVVATMEFAGPMRQAASG